MLVECGVSIYAAKAAHSAALLAFGSDSFVELLSASLVLAQCIPGVAIAERRANRVAGGLLFLLAVMVAATAVASLALRVKPETSGIGMAITIAALVAMPVLAWLKRREARRTGQCCAGGGCGAVGDVRLSGAGYAGGAGGERCLSHCMDGCV